MYAQMGYGTPIYEPKDTDLLALFPITPQDGVDPVEAAAAVAANRQRRLDRGVDGSPDACDMYRARRTRSAGSEPGRAVFLLRRHDLSLFEEGSIATLTASSSATCSASSRSKAARARRHAAAGRVRENLSRPPTASSWKGTPRQIRPAAAGRHDPNRSSGCPGANTDACLRSLKGGLDFTKDDGTSTRSRSCIGAPPPFLNCMEGVTGFGGSGRGQGTYLQHHGPARGGMYRRAELARSSARSGDVDLVIGVRPSVDLQRRAERQSFTCTAQALARYAQKIAWRFVPVSPNGSASRASITCMRSAVGKLRRRSDTVQATTRLPRREDRGRSARGLDFEQDWARCARSCRSPPAHSRGQITSCSTSFGDTSFCSSAAHHRHPMGIQAAPSQPPSRSRRWCWRATKARHPEEARSSADGAKRCSRCAPRWIRGGEVSFNYASTDTSDFHAHAVGGLKFILRTKYGGIMALTQGNLSFLRELTMSRSSGKSSIASTRVGVAIDTRTTAIRAYVLGMYGAPIVRSSRRGRIMQELAACRKTFPQYYIRRHGVRLTHGRRIDHACFIA